MSALTGRRRAGLLIPLFSCPSTASWGIGDIGDVAPLTAWLAAGRPARAAAAAAQRDGARAAVALLGDQRDGDRSDLHPRARRARVRGAGRRSRARRRAIATRSPRCAARRASTTQTVRRLKNAALRAAFDRFLEAEWRRDTPRARRAARVRSASRRGGSRTTRCSAPSTRARASAPWTEWPDALQRREPAAIDRARRELARRSAVLSVPAVASPTRSGSDARDAHARRRSCSAICRSWSTATAPTSGRGSISSASTCRSARRPTRSAPPARTGACRSIAGT